MISKDFPRASEATSIGKPTDTRNQRLTSLGLIGLSQFYRKKMQNPYLPTYNSNDRSMQQIEYEILKEIVKKIV